MGTMLINSSIVPGFYNQHNISLFHPIYLEIYTFLYPRVVVIQRTAIANMNSQCMSLFKLLTHYLTYIWCLIRPQEYGGIMTVCPSYVLCYSKLQFCKVTAKSINWNINRSGANYFIFQNISESERIIL